MKKFLIFLLAVVLLVCNSCMTIDRYYSDLIKNDPCHYSYYYKRSLYYFYNKNDYAKAIKDMDVYISHSHDKRKTVLYALRGTSKSMLLQDSSAIEDYKMALILNNNNDTVYYSEKDQIQMLLSDVYFNLSISYQAIRDKDNAMRSICKAICLNKTDKSYYVREKEIREKEIVSGFLINK